MEKLKVAVLFGGCSSEYGVSLQSAYSVITHIDTKKYEPVLLGITKHGGWRCFTGSPEKIIDDTWDNSGDCVRAIISPEREIHGVIVFYNDKLHTIRLDAAMPVLHGKNGEDGTVQGLLELAGIPVAGCKTLASALGMDKDKARKIAKAVGVLVPRYFTLKHVNDVTDFMYQVENLGYPLFVKPVKAGSSYGITKILSGSELSGAVELAFKYDDEIIIEENITGFEVSCGILGDDSLVTGAINEVELAADAPANSFFDYDEKYSRKTANVHVPARIPAEIADEIRDTAITIYKALGCKGFARVDMFLTPEGKIVFNEINTIPGFTEYSHYANMMKVAGISYEKIINTIIELAVKR